MRIKNILIFFIALFLPFSVSSFAGDGPDYSKLASHPPEAQSQISETQPQEAPVQQEFVQEQAQDAAAFSQVTEPTSPEVEVPKQVIETQPQVAEVAPQVVQAPSPEVVDPTLASAQVQMQAPQGALAVAAEKPGPNFFAERFFAPSTQKLDHKITEIRGFPILKTHSREQNAEYSIVTDFGGEVVKSRYLPGLKDPKAIDAYIKSNLQTAVFEGVEIRQLPLADAKGQTTTLYWVGDRAFTTPEGAAAEITAIKSQVESRGGNFAAEVSAAPVYIPEPEKPIEIKTPAQFQKEEELILKFTDQMGIGEKMYGVLQGDPCGTPITWQSFGETSWRMTNLAANHYDTQVGYWTNRLVFSGIRFPLHNIDPFIESTVSMDSTDTTWTNNLQLYAGLEWRPLARNPWLLNFQPFGGIPILEWMRNYRFYIKYGDRYNIKGQITGSNDYDLIWGVQCYYEWGTELPPLDETKAEKFTDYLRQYVWGEYYGDYYVSKTGFNAEEDFNAFIANSSIIMGVKLPGIPIPHNYINDELVLMPYMRFEHVNNSQFSFWYQNQYFLAAGLRVMPFRNYRWKENEWLSKMAIFGEWCGIGGAQHVKQATDVPNVPNYDLRFGVKFSSRRF